MSDIHACAHCGEGFLEAAHRDLHAGRRHPGALTPAEQERFAAAVADEEAWLVRLRLHMKAGLVVVPVFLFYVFVLLVIDQMEGNVAQAIMVTPGFVAFGALMYGMMYVRQKAKAEGVVLRPDTWQDPGRKR